MISSSTFSTIRISYSYAGVCSYTYEHSYPQELVQHPMPMTKAEIAREKMKKYLITLSMNQNHMSAPSLDHTAPSFIWRVHRMRGIKRRTRREV